MAAWASVAFVIASLSLAAGERQNVALYKPASMSTTRQPSQSAANAVDGVTTANSETFSAHTRVGESTAWWKVDLQTQVQSAQVTIYFRTDYWTRRNGIQLYTSVTNSSEPKEGSLCHTVTGSPDGTDIPDVLNVTCPGTWSYLTVYTNTSNDRAGALLDFAEVEVWISACGTGWYGEGCTKNCRNRNCKIQSATCNPVTGMCPDGCGSGFKGDDCLQTCISGQTYGDNCTKYCASRHCLNARDSCPPVTGACSSAGCQQGWAGPDCTACISGQTYGDNCTKYCASRHCLNARDSCPLDTGACSGCQQGWAGPDCTACTSGYYGSSCDQLCAARHCKSDSSCDVIQGRCMGGCTAGYQGTDCIQACDPGSYGEECSKSCRSRHCKTQSDTCNHTSGVCSDGCKSGYKGEDCMQSCTSGMYGPDCARECSSRHCKTPSSSCDRVTGQCPDGCEDGWTEIDCIRNCAVGFYGNNCSLKCADRHCTSTPCLGDGVCSAGCDVGWTLQDCTQECPRGTYGINCKSTCGHCADNNTCHHVTGACPGGCQAGWQLDLCQTVCDNGKFGVNCETDCGHCNGTCDAVDGRCLWGCAEGYIGCHCSVKLGDIGGAESQRGSAITPTTAGIIGLAAGICFMLILGVGLYVGLVRQGRLQGISSSEKDAVEVKETQVPVDKDTTQPSDNYTSISEQAGGRNIYNNDYAALDVEAKANNDYDVIKNQAYENL